MSTGDRSTDDLFREAVEAIDAADTHALSRLLAAHPPLAHARLESPGAWLRDRVGDALEGYFHRPYLLWFVAGNPVRNERLPSDIAAIAAMLAEAARHAEDAGLQEQLDYALGLIVTGRVARESGVQIALMDALIDGGARPGDGIGALGAANLEAAAHLLDRGGTLTLAGALCLGRREDAARLARTATHEERQIALVAAAVNGDAQALATLIGLGVDIDAYSIVIHPHATALHQAVAAGSLGAVEVLAGAGARLNIRDKIHRGTPLQWAEYGGHDGIARYLRSLP
ncbi:ankyrin repeat domain-containing protein [Luteimonas gilva]|uniref:Ankyrin repeat domain-containing protein n=1 Tax=Luteimonas gilva TaxID=2572684 RepID=A0A4U5JMD6_9GAMM|nr:ankyrin repeat domain-containing protein [Luteimonas gilva]TKR30714.1 ankyrin repeat domain-containing protein [Luteimonas gilva]